MKKQIKKRNIIICSLVITALVVALFAFAASPAGKLMYFNYVSTWKYNANFDDYEREFVLIKDYIEDNVEKDKVIFSYTSALEDHPYQLYNFDTKEYMDCPEEVYDALKTIDKEAFEHKDSHFDEITYDNGRIIFGGEGIAYGLIYSPNGRPTYLYSADEDFDIKVKKIQKDWYHVVRDPN